jgi:hypothetical protein
MCGNKVHVNEQIQVLNMVLEEIGTAIILTQLLK